MTATTVDDATDAFAATLMEWRLKRGLSKKQLAHEMGFDPSYVSHVEARRHRPTEDFARRAEAALRSGGLIWQRYRAYEQARAQAGPVAGRRDPVVPEQWLPHSAGLVVSHERSQLSYADGVYRCRVRRDLVNAGREPVTRYLVRISVDRYPGEPERSNRLYRRDPLTWAELEFEARCGDESMDWYPKVDRDALKEIWLLFANDNSRFPLYPGCQATIEYVYSVGEHKWGHWFQRAVRLPTRRLSVELDFPADTRPVVWGTETSLTAEVGPLRTPMAQRRYGERTVFDWSTEDPPLNARYRLEWRFRGPPDEPGGPGPAVEPAEAAAAGTRVSDAMRAAGIVQRGAPVLDRAARWFDLPEQAPLARDVVARLLEALDRVEDLYEFGKGVGLAAPQLAIGWAAAVIRSRSADGPPEEPVVLLNPRVVGESLDADEQIEGCLSFFDYRGPVRRPLLLEVEHERMDGTRTVTTFTRGAARLVAHEIDHLAGLLYTDRMAPTAQLIPIDQYTDQGQPWRY